MLSQTLALPLVIDDSGNETGYNVTTIALVYLRNNQRARLSDCLWSVGLSVDKSEFN